MSKSQVFWVIVIAFFVGALGSVILGRFVVPYVSTFPHFGWLNNLITTSPIVVQRTETVQLNEGVNLIDLIKQSENFTVSIYDSKNTFLGNGIIATSDGTILTSSSILPKAGQITVTTNDGQNFTAIVKQSDVKTGVAILAIEASNLPVVQFDDAASLEPGQRVIYIGRGNVKFEREAVTGFVTQSLANQAPVRNVTTDAAVTTDYLGGPVVNLSGHVVGLVLTPTQAVIGEDLKTFLNNYLSLSK